MYIWLIQHFNKFYKKTSTFLKLFKIQVALFSIKLSDENFWEDSSIDYRSNDRWKTNERAQ